MAQRMVASRSSSDLVDTRASFVRPSWIQTIASRFSVLDHCSLCTVSKRIYRKKAVKGDRHSRECSEHRSMKTCIRIPFENSSIPTENEANL